MEAEKLYRLDLTAEELREVRFKLGCYSDGGGPNDTAHEKVEAAYKVARVEAGHE